MIKKNKVVFKKDKNFDKLVAKYESEKLINYEIKWDNLLKKVVDRDL